MQPLSREIESHVFGGGFFALHKVVQTFESGNKILKYDHSNGSNGAIPFCGIVYYAVQGGSNF